VETIDRKTGRKLVLALVDSKTGAAVPAQRVQFRPGPGADDTIRKLLDNLDAGRAK
jgi:hypothetical protein